MAEANATSSDLELVLERIVDAPRERLFDGWTNAKLMPRWFAPAPLTTTVHELDVRPGGVIRATMRDPNTGAEYPANGVYLEIVKNERLVWTDAYGAGWEPSQKPFMTAIITFEEAGPGKTKYTARARHWTKADRDAHEKMGFQQGWSMCLDQLVALAKKG